MIKDLPTDFQQYIATSRYARWLEDKKRRETWEETVSRYCDFFSARFTSFPKEVMKEHILNLKVLPSMRALMTAGKALERDEIAGYNCSYVAVDHPRVFDETLYILMCGTGLGFSVERQHISKLPTIPEEFVNTSTTIIVKDSRTGWATAFKELISFLYSGQIPQWDTSKLRPAGAPLRTFGGRSSGPKPLEELFNFTVTLFKKAKGRKLNSVECHDLMCKIADVVVVGGVRRSALISLSDLSDDRMRHAKDGQWWEENQQRALANNSAVYTEKPEAGTFLREWTTLYESRSGERGIFNRQGAIKQLEKTGRRDISFDFGTNPCGEIILRPNGLCNLTEVVVRTEDTLEDLLKKVRLATILGTFQSTLTNFRYVRPVWKHNAEEECLLGVSLTGIMDHLVLSGKTGTNKLQEWLQTLKTEAIESNKEWAKILEINPSTSITTVKPSGTVSQLVDSASGIHPRYSEYYIRTVRADINDPLCRVLKDSGIPVEPDVTKPEKTLVFSFPMKAPEKAIFRDDLTAIQQLEHYLVFKDCWCEHNPSITVYVREHEWFEVGAWVYKHFDSLVGVSFLPHSDHIYKQAPYQEISKEEYLKVMESFPNISWELLGKYEHEDQTKNQQTLSCTAGVCELI